MDGALPNPNQGDNQFDLNIEPGDEVDGVQFDLNLEPEHEQPTVNTGNLL